MSFSFAKSLWSAFILDSVGLITFLRTITFKLSVLLDLFI